MTVSELLIIYLAVGAPFGVITLFKTKPGPIPVSLFWATAALCIWPALAFKKLLAAGRHNIFTNEFDDPSSFDAEIADKVREILLDSGKGRNTQFRSALERYAALASASLNSAALDLAQANEILTVGGHKNQEVGALCIARRNKKRLRAHQERAAADLSDEVEACLNNNIITCRTATQVGELCKMLNDGATEALIKNLILTNRPVSTRRLVSSVTPRSQPTFLKDRI